MTDWQLVQSVLDSGTNVLLYGPPGVGKTHAATRAARGRDVFSITLTPDMPAAMLLGHWLPRPGGQFSWLDGLAVQAWERGGLLVVNEVGKAGDDVLALMLALADDPSQTTLTVPSEDGGTRTVRPRPGFQLVATSNEGPDELWEPLVDRLVCLEITRPAPDLWKRFRDAAIASYAEAVLEKESDAYSTRRFLQVDELSRKLDLLDAFRAVFGDIAGRRHYAAMHAMRDPDPDD